MFSLHKDITSRPRHRPRYQPSQQILLLLLLLLLFIVQLTHSQTILENTVEIKPQPVALDFKNLSQYSSRSK